MLWPGTGRRLGVALVQLVRDPAAILLLLLLQFVHAALPPGAEDEIVLIEHLPGRRVHLQDFFWTGAEDAPPWLDPEQLLTLYETRTIHHTATVYIPEEQNPQTIDGEAPRPIDCASCIDPTPTLTDQDVGVLVGDDPGPRYWLLTVLKAGEDVPPKVELRLARLYKAAFTRQQQRHLGLLGPEPPPRRARGKNIPKRHAAIGDDDADNYTTVLPDTTTDSYNLTEIPTTTPIPSASPPSSLPRPPPAYTSLLHMRAVRITKSKRTIPILVGEELENLEHPLAVATTARNETANGTTSAKIRDVDVGLVQVRMQNTSVIDGGATRLIYTVHLGGKPVPAETAAKDMALLSAQEVALELGAPVLIQSEPLSRRRDAWLLAGAAGAGLFLLIIILVGLLFVTKRKRAQSAVVAPPRGIGGVLGKDEEYAPTTPGVDNTAYTSETEGRTEATSGQRMSRTPGSQETIAAADDAEARAALSDTEMEAGHGPATVRHWESREYGEAVKRGAPDRRPTDQRPYSADSVDSPRGDHVETTLDSLERGFGAAQEPTGSPHSYLSMPSCKQFPSMRSVEPLSKVLEPVVVKHLDLELDSPEMKIKDYDFMKGNGDHYFARAASDTKDPGVLGPIVWDLKRKRAVEGDATRLGGEVAQLDNVIGRGPVGRARRRLNELIEDSFSLFGSREPKHGNREHLQQSQPGAGPEARYYQPQQQPAHGQGGQVQERRGQVMMADTRGRSAHVSPETSPTSTDVHQHTNGTRPRTSQPRDGEHIPETGRDVGPHPRGAWGSRPLSAGPFHRPSLPEVEVVRVLADAPLRPEDPAVPLIAAIKKELHKFTYE